MNVFQQISQTKNFKKYLIISFFTFSALVWFGMWIYSHYYVSTDDAYINANVVQISPRVTGKVVKLYVANNQYVKKGELLFAIDPEPYKLAVDAAHAELALSSAELDNAIMTEKRVSSLVKKKYLSPQDGDNAIANLKICYAKVEQAKTHLAQAELNLQYTQLSAPATGWISNMTLRVGDIIPANQALFALISNEEFWADANFKETEMEAIKPGQMATITTDMYPNHPFKGVIESISGGAGTAFSLLPPQNATGNWVKVTQRVPIRVRILNPDREHQLRIGISADVKVHLHQYQS